MDWETTFKLIVIWIFQILYKLIVMMTDPIFRVIYEPDRNKFRVPSTCDRILYKPAIELASMIRRKEVSSFDVVNIFIERAKELKPLNAIVAERYGLALEEARKVDEVLALAQIPDKYSEENAPFLGVPFTAKEAFGIKGLPNTAGLLKRKGIIAEHDADMVAALKNAGAIPIALTNCSELCMWYESSNLLYGRCNNPYHQGRIVGGSSGGEGCIVSTAGTAMGVGSDIGGSIRMPAFFNGIFGHKATVGVVSSVGQFPLADGESRTYMASGPMVRYAADLLPMFKVMSKPAEAKLKLDQQVDVKKLRYFYMEDDGGSFLTSPVDKDIKYAILKAANHAKDTLGAQVEQVHIDSMKHSFDMWAVKMSSGGLTPFCKLMGNGTSVNPFWELILWLVQHPRHTLPAIGLGIGEKFPVKQADVARLRNKCEQLKEEFRQLLGDDGVFLYPTHPVPAPYHNQPLTLIANFSYTGVFNILGLPVTCVPMGLSREGVPIGIQVVSNYYNDHITIAVANELEKAFGGWVPPFAESD